MFVKSQLADWDLTSLTCANQISRWVGSNYYQLLFHVNSPQFDISACGSTESPEYVTQFSCLGNNLLFPEYSEQQHREREARLSFLSGHSSLAWYGMIFAAGYIQRLRNKSSTSHLHPFLVVLQVRTLLNKSEVVLVFVYFESQTQNMFRTWWIRAHSSPTLRVLTVLPHVSYDHCFQVDVECWGRTENRSCLVIQVCYLTNCFINKTWKLSDDGKN